MRRPKPSAGTALASAGNPGPGRSSPAWTSLILVICIDYFHISTADAILTLKSRIASSRAVFAGITCEDC